MASDTSSWPDIWTFLFPPDIWTPIGDYLSTSASIAFVIGTVLALLYAGLVYADTTKTIPGAWNPWVIFWIVVVCAVIFLAIAWAISPLKLFGVEVLTTAPNTCVGIRGSSEGGLCYENCKPGYHGLGVRCYADSVNIGSGTVLGLEPCPVETDGQGPWVNMGLTCTRWKRECNRWGTDIIGYWWTGCVETVGRLDKGGQCPGPQDFEGNYDDEIKKWKEASDKKPHIPDAAVDGHQTCADVAEIGTDKHTERIDGMCYKKCPTEYPEHIPGMPYLCYKGGELSYDRGGGVVPALFRVFGKYAYTPITSVSS